MIKQADKKPFKTLLLQEGIVFTEVAEGSDITIEQARQNTLDVIAVSGGKIYPMLVDIHKIRSISKEARDHFSMRGRKGHVNSIAILIRSPLSRIIGNFFMGLNKPSVPTKLFTDQKTAMAWLKTFLNE